MVYRALIQIYLTYSSHNLSAVQGAEITDIRTSISFLFFLCQILLFLIPHSSVFCIMEWKHDKAKKKKTLLSLDIKAYTVQKQQ